MWIIKIVFHLYFPNVLYWWSQSKVSSDEDTRWHKNFSGSAETSCSSWRLCAQVTHSVLWWSWWVFSGTLLTQTGYAPGLLYLWVEYSEDQHHRQTLGETSAGRTGQFKFKVLICMILADGGWNSAGVNQYTYLFILSQRSELAVIILHNHWFSRWREFKANVTNMATDSKSRRCVSIRWVLKKKKKSIWFQCQGKTWKKRVWLSTSYCCWKGSSASAHMRPYLLVSEES